MKNSVPPPKSTPIPTSDGELRRVVARIDDQTRATRDNVVDLRSRVKGLFTFRNWLIGLIVVIVASASSFAIMTQANDSTHTAKLEADRSDIDRHEGILEDLPRKSDFKRVSDAVKAVPRQVRKLEDQPKTAREVEIAAEELPLKRHELEALRLILSRAKDRE